MNSIDSLQSAHILITDQVEEEMDALKQRLYPSRVVPFYKDDFLIDDAKEVIREAYIAEDKISKCITKALGRASS